MHFIVACLNVFDYLYSMSQGAYVMQAIRTYLLT